MSVPFGAAIAVVLALIVILIDWETIRERVRRRRRRGLVMINELGRRVEIEGGLHDVGLFAVVFVVIVDVVLSFFVGQFALGRWIWCLA